MIFFPRRRTPQDFSSDNGAGQLDLRVANLDRLDVCSHQSRRKLVNQDLDFREFRHEM